MQPRFSFRLLVSFYLLIASIFSTSGYGKGSPSSFSATANKPLDQFVCGTYRGNEMESMWHYCHYQNALKKQLAIPAADFVSDDVWVVEDDGLILQSGVNTFDTDSRTFRFNPNGNGYDVSETTFNFDAIPGSNLSLGDDTNSTRTLSFTFDFFGVPWSDIHINANGIVSFGADINPSGFYDNDTFFSELPKIAPYFVDLNPAVGGGVFAKSESDKFTVTWNGIVEFGTSNSNTFQLVLFSDGSFEVTFNGIAATIATSGTPIAFGIHPGGNPNLELISFSDALPFSGGAGAGIFENYFNITQPIVNEVGLLQRFYQSFPDSFFQIAFFTNFIQTMGGFANERNLKNAVRGIGLNLFDQSDLFGSNGVLESRLNMNRLGVWPADPEQRFFSDGSNFLTIMGQETGHRWGAFVNFVSTNGQLSNLILGRSDAHWSFYFDVDHSMLEGGNWEEVSPNSYVVPTQIDFFSEIDEYIMGLRTPEEVKPMFFISSLSNNLPQNRDKGTPPLGATATGTAVEVTIEDIIAVEGDRIPREPDAPKDLRQAFILVTQNGNVPTPFELDKIAAFRRAWEDYFEVSVDGRFALNTSLTRTFPVAVLRGQVIDAITKLPIPNIQAKSVERGFSQFVAGGGRYTFRYMANENSGDEEQITVEVSAAGYEPGSLNTALTYGKELEFDFELQPLATSVEQPSPGIPLTFTLHQNFPNPFNPTTEIRYELADPGDVAITIYDVLGKEVRTFVKTRQGAGTYAIQWDGKNNAGLQVASGVYFLKLTANVFRQTRKMLLMR